VGRFSIGVPAENGRKALDAARKAALYVVVTDVDMPVMDGVDLRRHLRAGTATRDVVVIVVTGDASESGRAALETGCDAVLRKPCSGVLLLETIRRLLDARRSVNAPGGWPFEQRLP
jgi:CheY-like chemotaxis protein